MKTNPEDINLMTLAREYSDETKARELFESWRWPDGKPVCPHCQGDDVYTIKSKENTAKGNKVRAGLYCCAACRKTFTATVGTVLEDSHIPLNKWVMAMFIMCSSKKSVSALQISRMLTLTYKSAWFMCHRIRHALMDERKEKLKGVVEADETFVGGKGDIRTKLSRKTPVMALIEQGGNMKVEVVANVSQQNLGRALRGSVDKTAILCTDEHSGYKEVGTEFKEHYTVNHSKEEYIVKMPDGVNAGVNHCESFFALLKRGVHGTWHNVSRQHLPKYANEFAFRWNTRKLSDGERMGTYVPLVAGKRLLYRKPKALSGLTGLIDKRPES